MAQATATRKRPRATPKPEQEKPSPASLRGVQLIHPREHQTTVSSKYQVVIPKRAREQAGIKPGQKLDVQVQEGIIYLVPIRPISELQGFAPEINLDDIREEVDRF